MQESVLHPKLRNSSHLLICLVHTKYVLKCELRLSMNTSKGEGSLFRSQKHHWIMSQWCNCTWKQQPNWNPVLSGWFYWHLILSSAVRALGFSSLSSLLCNGVAERTTGLRTDSTYGAVGRNIFCGFRRFRAMVFRKLYPDCFQFLSPGGAGLSLLYWTLSKEICICSLAE